MTILKRMFWKSIAYTKINYNKIAYRLLITIDLGQVGKKSKRILKFPTNVFYQMKLLHLPPMVSAFLHFSVSICKDSPQN